MLAPSFLLTIGILIPFFVAIFYSFTDLTLRSPEYEMVGFQNFADTFSNPDFWHSVGVTLRYAFIATAVQMVLGMCIALLLNHENAFSRFLRLVLIFPLMIAPVIGALIWLLITNPSGRYSSNTAWMDWTRRISMECRPELGTVLAYHH